MGAGITMIILNNLTPWGLEGEKNETGIRGKTKHECYETAKGKCLTENLICPCSLMILEAGRKSPFCSHLPVVTQKVLQQFIWVSAVVLVQEGMWSSSMERLLLTFLLLIKYLLNINHRTEIIDLFFQETTVVVTCLSKLCSIPALCSQFISWRLFLCEQNTLGSSVCTLMDWKSAECRCKMNRNISQKQENKLNIWEKQILPFVILGSIKSVSSCVPLRLQTVDERRGWDSNYQQERSHQASQNPLHQKSWVYCHLLWTAYILLCLQRLCMVRKKI